MLMHIMFHILAPQSLGGCDGVVVLFDCDSRFNISRFVTVVETQITHSADLSMQIDPKLTRKTVLKLLHRLIIIQPTSSASLLDAIRGVLPYFLNQDEGLAARAICIDSLSSNFWMDTTASPDSRFGIFFSVLLIPLTCVALRLPDAAPSQWNNFSISSLQAGPCALRRA
jgi:hypothetical protein